MVNEASTERCEQCVSRAVRGVFTRRSVPAPPRHLEGSIRRHPAASSVASQTSAEGSHRIACSFGTPPERGSCCVCRSLIGFRARRAFHVCVGGRRRVERRVTDRSPAPSDTMSSTVYRLDHRGIPFRKAVMPKAQDLYMMRTSDDRVDEDDSLGPVAVIREEPRADPARSSSSVVPMPIADVDAPSPAGEASVAMDYAVMKHATPVVRAAKKAPRTNADMYGARTRARAAVPYPSPSYVPPNQSGGGGGGGSLVAPVPSETSSRYTLPRIDPSSTSLSPLAGGAAGKRPTVGTRGSGPGGGAVPGGSPLGRRHSEPLPFANLAKGNATSRGAGAAGGRSAAPRGGGGGLEGQPSNGVLGRRASEMPLGGGGRGARHHHLAGGDRSKAAASPASTGGFSPQEMYEQTLEAVWRRVETLPFVVCKAASGESFKVRRARRSSDVEQMLLRQLGFNEADLSMVTVEKHTPWELHPHDVSGPEEWAAIRMRDGAGPEGLSEFYEADTGNPSEALISRRKAIIDARNAAKGPKKQGWKNVFDRRGHNAKVKGTENRKLVNKNVLNFLDRGVSEKEEEEGIISVALSPRPPPESRSALYAAVLEWNREAHSEAAARSAHEESKTAAREANDIFRNSITNPGRAPETYGQRLRDSIKEMQGERPFFRLPILGRDRFERAKVTEAVVLKKVKEPWHIDRSIFAPRKAESDAKAYLDNKLVKTKRLATDWARACSKAKFKKAVMSADADSQTEDDLKEELEEVRQAFERNYDALFCAFTYFCITGNDVGEDAYSMGLNQWTAFLTDCEIPDNDSKTCRSSDLDTAFIVTNFEEDKGSEINRENDDRALMGFEFLEIIVRVAVAKYIKSKQVTDVSEAVEKLCVECIQPNLCPEAVLVPNHFRERRLYFEEIAEIFEHHEPFLRAVYGFYSYLHGHKQMQMEGWIDMCEHAKLLGPKTGVSKREAKLIYAWSQMQVSDEIKKRNKLISMTFVDFIEAIGRISEIISPPTKERLDEYFHATNPANTITPVWEYFAEVPEEEAEETRRESAEFTKPSTRPLRVKIEGVLEMIIAQLVRNYGVEMEWVDPREGSPGGGSPVPGSPAGSRRSSLNWASADPMLKSALHDANTDEERYQVYRKFHLREEERMLVKKMNALAKTMKV